MNLGKKVEIVIRDHKTGQYLYVPVIPQRIQYSDGAAINDTVRILEVGNVDFSNGVELDTLYWASFFPGRYDPSYVQGPWLDPTYYKNLIKSWKDNGAALQLIIPAAGISKKMTVDLFTREYRGFEGDLYYNIRFKEAKTVSPKKIKVSQSTQTAVVKVSAKKKEPKDRTPPPVKPKPKIYTIKSGDYLIKIAKAHKISNWRRDLYEPNKPPLGSNPGLIHPGQKLKLPG